ncbi:Pre-mRNA cleavage complex II protein Clp1-domain-containing protein [Gilbertella persicaria]|uniref:Pre-mRNA cleavage complex II protein Clp1-domain-containing protein n=1 Tax=Gilbertella persicaria TaxID=101096 RepID=UPI00221F30E9|nr:Pre-mRNA cleavage complex II protein Clp1-domain-containing protein [Gilbertella persicaria]KAI8076436.1 Pre-mRNA cleavage complex II protein Clp1-domain-containing protein [Gilbertella persicaria]
MQQEKEDNLGPSRQIVLGPDHEFRFEVEFNTKAQIKLVKGTAEIFGTELAVGVVYTFTGRKAAVYTWHGCTLEVRNTFLVEYTANETPMTSYLNTHLALEQLRIQARKEANTIGPRVLVIGPHDVGKTSLCKILVSYALRQGGVPIYVSLDTTEGSITMPGTVTATCINNIIDVEEGFGSSATTAASMGSSTMPLAYYYGFENPDENVKLYKMVTTQLSEAIKQRIAVDEECRTSGFIIDTAGLIDHVGYDIIQHVIEEFSVNVVIVLGHERLYSDMTRILAGKSVSVVKLSKSGGVVERDRQFKTRLQRTKIHEYFYGSPKCELSPYSMLVNYDDIKIWRVGDVIAPSSALPLGMDSSSDETQVVRVDNYDMCLHSILAMLNTEDDEHENKLLSSNVAGFIYVSDVDEEKKKVTILSPSPGRLPKKNLLMGSFKWMES